MDKTNQILSLNKIKNDQKGLVLIITLSLLAILTLTGTIVINSVNTDIKISSNFRTSKQAFYAAEAGTEEARERLSLTTTDANFIGDAANPNPPNGSWSTYLITNSTTLSDSDWHAWLSVDDHDPDYDATYTRDIKNSNQTEIPFRVRIKHKREFDAIPGSYIDDALATNSGIILYGYTDTSIQNTPVQFATTTASIYSPVEIITAYGSSSTSVKNIEIEVVRNPGMPVLATLYSEADVTVNGGGGGTVVSGDDACGVASPVDTIYTLSPGTTNSSGSPTYSSPPVDGTNNLDIEGYIDAFRDGAEVLTDKLGNNISDWGSSTNFKRFFSDSTTFSPQLTNLDDNGFGILMIEGDVKLNGGFSWDGIILVTGTATLNGGGGGINIRGALYANHTVTINGGIDARYDSCAINNALNTQVMQIIKWNHKYQ